MIRVLIVDDSPLMRQLLSAILAGDREIEVVGTATDPIAAQKAIAKLAPDVLTLDVEMPKMDGLTFLERLMRMRPIPVVMVSTLTERGGDLTLRALALGAFDFVTKPRVDIANGTVDLGDELIAKVKAAARSKGRSQRRRLALTSPPAPAPLLGRATPRFIAVGASTGGTEALRELLEALPADSPPIVIVQHMPRLFTAQFAQRLDRLCRVSVREARHGDLLRQGEVLVAPGSDTHMEVASAGSGWEIKLTGAPAVNHHRPSVDTLFASCARLGGRHVVGVLLTGMGDDGARGMRALRDAGARTIAQDETTCVVFGMPKEAIARGGVEAVLPLERIGPAMLRCAREGAASAPVARPAAPAQRS